MVRTRDPDRHGEVYAIADGDGNGDDTCSHESVAELGADGSTRFFRCVDCGGVLLRTTAGPQADGSDDDLGTVDPRLEDLLEDIDAYHAGEPTSYTSELPRSTVGRLADACRRLLG